MDLNPTKDDQAERTRTENYEGGEAFEPDSAKRELYELTINNLLEDTFYREDEDAFSEVRRAIQAVAEEDEEFIFQLAKHARQDMYLRDISLVLLVIGSYYEDTEQYTEMDEGRPHAIRYASDIISRADEPMRVKALWDWVRENLESGDADSMSKTLQKAIGFAMKQFDAYQLAKYDTDRREVNLKDVLNVAHPHPDTEKQNELYRRLTYGNLDSGQAWKEAWEFGEPVSAEEVEPLDPPETWEVVISERGNTQEAWEDVLNRMGLFARVRNLRNMLEADVPAETILNTPIEGKDYESGETFTINEDGMTVERVRQAKMYPFRFYTAYLELEKANIYAPEIAEFLENAVNVGAEELDDAFGDSVVGVDVSGSMRHRLSNNSVVEYMDIAALFGGVFGTKGADTYGFATDYERVAAHPSTPAIEYARKFYEWRWGEATHADEIVRHLIEEEIEAQRIVLLTDGQVYSRGYRTDSFRDVWLDYKEKVAPEASIYILDLSSYGDLIMPENQPDAYQLSGWNDNILDFMQAVEDPDEVIGRIEEIEPSMGE